MAQSTPATLALRKLAIAFEPVTYAYDPQAERVGLQAAAALAEPPGRVLKTLVAQVDGKPVCLVLPSDREAGMKKVAAAFGGRSAAMLPVPEAERLTGYKVGGVSPFGQKRRLRTAIDATVLGEPPMSTSMAASAGCSSSWHPRTWCARRRVLAGVAHRWMSPPRWVADPSDQPSSATASTTTATTGRQAPVIGGGQQGRGHRARAPRQSPGPDTGHHPATELTTKPRADQHRMRRAPWPGHHARRRARARQSRAPAARAASHATRRGGRPPAAAIATPPPPP